jgi:hypothetical protein
MTGMKYIRFRDLYQIEKNKMTELLNTILASLSSSKPIIQENHVPLQHHIEPPPVVNHINSTSAPLHPLDRPASTSNAIHAWFAEHRISTQLRDLFDFQSSEEMLDYAELLIKDREKQMDIYARIFTQKYRGNDLPPHEFNRFANALERLLKEKRPSSTFVKPTSAMPVKSGTCTIL